MGADKSLMVVGGQALARTVADVMGHAGAHRVQAQGGDAAALASLGLSCVADRWPGRGPGVAVADVLVHAAAGSAVEPDIVVVAACDHPDLDVATVHALVAALGRGEPETGPGSDDGSSWPAAAVAVAVQRRHPTLCAWRRSLCAPIAGQWMENGGSSLTSLLEAVSSRHDVVEVAVEVSAVRDLDSPGDVSRYDRGVPHHEVDRQP
jgi:molybdopterin-guanine dinucleotide biosynthesis protein A